MEIILSGAELLFSWQSLLFLVAGLMSGFAVGSLPGFAAPSAAALLVPMSTGLSLEQGLLLVLGVYLGAQFAGAVPAILINIPGEAGGAVTALDGYPLAQQGKAVYAIGLARMASAFGGLFAGIVVISIIGPLSDIAIMLGPREMFILTMCALAVLAGLVGDNIIKGVISALMGLALAAVSANPQNGIPRMTFDIPELFEQLPFIPAMIGLFGVSQILLLSTTANASRSSVELNMKEMRSPQYFLDDLVVGVKTALRHPALLSRSGSIGLMLGILPGIGTSIANFLNYTITKRRSKSRVPFGTGNPEGVLTSEASDNAAATGALVPTFALGVPGSPTAAVMLAMFYTHGIEPGPRVITTHGTELYAVLLGAIVAAVLIIPIGLILSAPLVAVTRTKPSYLVGPILALCVIGAYAYRNSLFDVMLALLFGILGTVMRMYGYPVIPLVFGLVLGPIIETQFLRAIAIGGYDVGYFFSSALGNGLWAVLLLAIVLPGVSAMRSRSRLKRRL